MAKSFFEVFPVLKVNAEIQQLLANTQVQRVVSNRERTRLRIYLHGTRLIPKSRSSSWSAVSKASCFRGRSLR